MPIIRPKDSVDDNLFVNPPKDNRDSHGNKGMGAISGAPTAVNVNTQSKKIGTPGAYTKAGKKSFFKRLGKKSY